MTSVQYKDHDHPVVQARSIVQRVLLVYLLLTLMLALVLAVLGIAVLVGPQGGTPAVDQLVRRSSTQFVWPWSSRELRGTVTFDGARLPMCAPAAVQPPVVLAIDSSRSMQGEPLAQALRTAEQLASSINVQSFRIGAVAFADTTTVLQAPTTQVEPLISALVGVSVGEDSRIGAGVDAAGQLITAGGQANIGTLILISDGVGNASDLAAATAKLKQQGVRVVVVPVGSGVDATFLDQVASSPEDVIAPDGSAMESLLREYAVDLDGLVGRDFVLSEQYDRGGFQATGAEPPPSGAIDQQIVWRSYFLPAQTQTYSYTVNAAGFGLYALAPRGGAVYLDCGNTVVQTATPAGPYVLVLPPWLLWLLLPLLLLLVAWLILTFWPVDDPRRVVLPPPTVIPPSPLRPQLLDPLPPAFVHAPYGRATPTLVIGLGGSGEAVLQHIHRNVWELTPDGQLPEHMLLLSVDVDQPERNQHLQEYLLQTLPDHECLRLTPQVMETARQFERNRTAFPHLDEWLRIERQISAGEFQVTSDQAGQRQYGRLVMFDHLKQGLANAALYQAVAERLGQLDQQGGPNEPVRIFVVASLSGGFSSGVLGDVVHLIRKVADQTLSPHRNYTVQPFLIPGGALPSQAGHRSARANTVATLRELDRLMTLSNRQMLMAYTAAEFQQRPEQSMVDTLVFDYAFVVDTTRNDRTFGNRSLHETLYPAIADAIMLMMDRQANASLTDYYNQVRAVIRAEQRETTRAIFNSLGMFSYRVPMRLLATLIECVVLRAMLEQLFGLKRSNGKLSMPDADPQLVGDLVSQFLQRTASELPEHGANLTAFGSLTSLLAGVSDAHFRDTFIRQIYPDPHIPIDHAPAYIDQFMIALQRLVFNILAETAPSAERHGGRLPVALAVLERLKDVFATAQRSIRATDQADPGAKFAYTVLAGCSSRVEAFAAELRGWREYALEQSANGLYEQISNRERVIRGQLEMLQRAAVRHYLFEEYLPDLSAHFQQVALEQSSRFFWQVAIDTQQEWKPSIALGFVGVEVGSRRDEAGPGVMLLRRDVPPTETLDHLYQLAHTLVAPIWNDSIYSWLERRHDDPASPRSLAEQLLRDSSAFLRYEQIDAPNTLKTRFLATAPAEGPAANQYLRDMTNRLRSESIRPGDLQCIDLTNHFNCMLLNALNVLPIETIALYSPDGAYRADYDALETRQQQRLHVYGPEELAIGYESRLVERANIDRRMLHPRVVALLSNLPALELLLLSFAHRLLVRRGADWFLLLDGLRATQLTDESGEQTLIEALDQAILGKPRRNLLDANMLNREQVVRLRRSLDQSYARAAQIAALDAAMAELREQYIKRFSRHTRSLRERMPEQMHEDLLGLLLVLGSDLRDAIALADIREEEIRQ